MTYSAVHKKMIIDKDSIDRSINSILWAMKKYRQISNVPLGKRKDPRGLKDIDHAEKGLIDGLKSLGIDLGVEWGCDLDLTSVGS